MDSGKQKLMWMIRDNRNVIRGPYPHQEVLNLLRKSQLKAKTELARANSYWFTVEEKAELAKFFPELGLEAPADGSPTQMTATLTKAVLDDHPEPTTQITRTAEIAHGGEPASAEPSSEQATLSNESGIQWLNDEMAEEFGEYASAESMIAPASGNATEEVPTYVEGEKEEMLKRATVKADTLPSEHRDFQGERPKPINNLMRAPERAEGGAPGSNTVKVPMNVPDPHVLILQDKDPRDGNRTRLAPILITVGAIALIAGAYVISSKKDPKAKAPVVKKLVGNLSPDESLKRALIIYDFERAKAAIGEIRRDPELKEIPAMAIAEAVVKKEFSFDADSAAYELQNLRPRLPPENPLRNEVDNLVAVYGFDRDHAGSVEQLRRIVKMPGVNRTVNYNLALALLRSGQSAEAVTVASNLLTTLMEGDSLLPDTAILLGWAQELENRGGDAEASFSRALSADPASAKARLGLAIHRLRKSGLRAAEADFRAFVDSAPELDTPSRALNFRQMSNFEFYTYARNKIRELNLDGPMGSKPSPLVMAVDAMLSCMQNRTAEAGKILEGALSAAPGDVNVTKAVGYHRWRESRFSEIVELFKDMKPEKGGFAVPFIMAKALTRLERKPQAQKLFEQLVTAVPNRSEPWSQLGQLQLEAGKEQDAKIKFVAALRKDPLDLVALRGLEQIGMQSIFTAEIMENLPF